MDAVVDVENQVIDLGVVIRNSEGICKAAAVKSVKFSGNVAMDEAATME